MPAARAASMSGGRSNAVDRHQDHTVVGTAGDGILKIGSPASWGSNWASNSVISTLLAAATASISLRDESSHVFAELADR